METNEVMEVEAIEVEETDLIPCEEDVPLIAESSGLDTLGGLALLLGAVVGGAAVIVKGSQKVYVRACNKKGMLINSREKAWQFWRPKAKKVKIPDEFQTEDISGEDISGEDVSERDWTKEE